MKNITKHLLLISAVTFLGACTESNTQLKSAKALYEVALANSDQSTVKVALNQLLLIDSTNTVYQDSLSRLYISSGNFEAGLRYAEKVFNAGKADVKLKENMALAYQQIGKTDKAEQFVNSLKTETNDYKYEYQKLVISYENRDQILFDSLSKSILAEIEIDSLVARTTVPMPGPVSGVNQLVPLKAATYFLIGNNALENNRDVNTAVEYLQKSLEEYGEFEMSRYVLMEIEKMMMASRR
jgi:tetratricopeptide (TPR) repeat protein